MEISRRGLGPCARGAAGAERGGELRGWPVPSPGRSNRGNFTVVGGDRAEEETDEEDENRRSMAAAHHRPQSGLCYQVAQLVLVKMYLRYILGPTKTKILYLEWVTNSADQIC